jgi:glycosyltransferase involved in cell wall biosynthesis
VVSGDVPWPLDSGGRIATYSTLGVLAEHYEIDLVCLRDPASSSSLTSLEPLCRSVVAIDHPFTFRRHRFRQGATAFASLFSREAYRLRKFRSPRLQATVSALVASERYDLVHYEQIGSVQPMRLGVPTTVSHHNVEWDLYRRGASAAHQLAARLWSQLEFRKLARSEPRRLEVADHVFALNTEDEQLLRDAGVASVSTLPIQVEPAPELRIPVEPSIFSVGTMSWFGVEAGLIWFHEEVWPRIKSAVPSASWTVAGANASHRIQRLGNEPGIRIAGYVPALEPELRQARVLVVPLFVAGGIRIKLLERMATAMPFVSTTLGARGIAVASGDGGFIADDSETFAAAVCTLLGDDTRWREMGQSGLRYIERNNSREAVRAAVLHGIEIAQERYGERAG